jgi:hypothetical protein
MNMLSASLAATSAVIALAGSGFVPAPASVSLFTSAAEAKQPRTSQTKGKSKQPRVRAKAKHSAASKRAQDRKQAARQAQGNTSKPPKLTHTAVSPPADGPTAQVKGKGRTVRFKDVPGKGIAATGQPPATGKAGPSWTTKRKAVASSGKTQAQAGKNGTRRTKGATSRGKTRQLSGKRPGGSRARTKSGKGKAATYAGKAATPPSAATPSTTAQSRTARAPRRKAKTNASPAMRAASRAGKQKRIASEASSMVTRTVRPLGGGAPITAARAPQARQGKKSRFYFNPFRSWFGGGKKT